MSDNLESETGSTVRRIQGPTILLGSGTYFDFEAPEKSAITIQDVAFGLASCNRFAGQTVVGGVRCFYTVAEHCYRMSLAVPVDMAFAALMHEAGEAVCGDMTAPLKAICPDYKVVEKRCCAAIQAAFGVPEVDERELKYWDLRMLATERRDLMAWKGEKWSWCDGVEPLPEKIKPIPAVDAAAAFLFRFRQLSPSETPTNNRGDRRGR